MTNTVKSFTNKLLQLFSAARLLTLSASALAEAEAEAQAENIRAMAVTMEAVVTDIDLETRQVSLRGPQGNIVTLTATEDVVKLEDVNVGDRLVATYIAALEGELRAPTEEEIAEPWVEVSDTGVSDDPEFRAVGEARAIRAVCTIEGMNRALGTVTIKDPRGKLHLIGDVEPEKMEGVSLGDTVVIIYREALALSLEPAAAQAAE
jgi:hypothetical protein